MGPRKQRRREHRATLGRRFFWTIFGVFLVSMASMLHFVERADSEPVLSPAETSRVARWKVKVLSIHPHDPTAFTQGLLWSGDHLYESTGLYGKSTLRRTEAATGEILERRALDPGYFGEGLAQIGDRLYQLTWKAGVVLVWDVQSLTLIDEHGYNGQGWGLAAEGSDGSPIAGETPRLLMSDGSSRLTFRAPEDFRWLSTLEVTLDGRPVERLNELEWVDGRIFANILGEESIVRIDPSTGEVDAVIDASGLLTAQERRMVDVLNGIAYSSESRTFWITGKFWPRLYEVVFEQAP